MSSPRFKSLDDYLASLDTTKARTVKSVLDFILTVAPDLECKIAWNVPQIHRRGEYVAGISAAKNYLTFSPWSPRIIADFKARLAPLVVLKHCFQIPVDWKLDTKLLADLVRARLAELD